jgi:hypothetical protein
MEGYVAATDVEEDLHSDLAAPVVAEHRWVDRLDSRLVNALTVVGFGAPAAVVFWLVAHYGVNVVEGDQWDDVTVIRNSYTNLFDWGSLWTQHNENRIFFPNLVVIALSRTTHFNVHAEEYLAAVMLVAATALIVLTHKRRSPDTPWLYYCPVAFLMLPVRQHAVGIPDGLVPGTRVDGRRVLSGGSDQPDLAGLSRRTGGCRHR